LTDAVSACGIDAARFHEAWRAPDIRQRVIDGFAAAKCHGTAALPSVLLDVGGTRRLVAGGYVDAPTLVATLRQIAGAE
jgi:protein-disulfide isomerase-like protein with CxxC motif